MGSSGRWEKRTYLGGRLVLIPRCDNSEVFCTSCGDRIFSYSGLNVYAKGQGLRHLCWASECLEEVVVRYGLILGGEA